ncbi:MAG: glutamine synthetase [Alphaproteobacteria bacterium]|nr:glutamine synthetase [Alphaproteobacteria bacterium]
MMLPSDVHNIEDAIKIVKERNLSHIKIGLFDIDGILRGKYISQKKFLSALENGLGFCDVVVGWDCNDQIYDNAKITGWHTAYPDAPVRIIPESCRSIPLEDNTLLFLCEFLPPFDEVCPRGIFKRVLHKANQLGFKVYGALEYEFFLFNETPESVREKNYQNLVPITPGYFGYSGLRSSVWSDLYHEILNFFEQMNIPIEGLHTETGPGVLEAALYVDEGTHIVDKAALFKTFMKVLAQKNQMMACFMAKWSANWPGQSGHIHLSLIKDEQAAFYDKNKPDTLSDTMKHFVAGQQKLMPEVLAMIAPTLNSYRRLIPGFWAPTHATWGIENRTCALRVIKGSPKSQRVEYRIAAADANPYLAVAAALGSGLYGIEHKMDLVPKIEGNSYTQDHPSHYQLPPTLWDATQKFKKSTAARNLFGDQFVDHFAISREWEVREFNKSITDWELNRYFEII